MLWWTFLVTTPSSSSPNHVLTPPVQLYISSSMNAKRDNEIPSLSSCARKKSVFSLIFNSEIIFYDYVLLFHESKMRFSSSIECSPYYEFNFSVFLTVIWVVGCFVFDFLSLQWKSFLICCLMRKTLWGKSCLKEK